MKHRRTPLRTPLLAALAALGLITPVFAETDNLDDFVVSATRQARDPFEVPASVDKINKNTLEKAASFQVNLSETLTRVPGLVINNRNNFAQDLQISIRGFGARATSGVRGVRLFSDGIPATMPDGSGQISHFSLSSTESIEVLRGPFSSLYGNSSGGVILLTTENPRPGTELEVNQIFGTDSTRRSGIKLNKGNEELGIVIDASTFRTDGYRDHSKARRDNFNSKMVWNLTTDTRLSWVVNYVDIPLAQDPAGLTAAQLAQNRRQGSPASVNNNSNKTVEQSQTGIVLEHQFTPETSVAFSPYYGDRKIRQVLATGNVIDLKNEYSGADLKFAHQTNLFEKPLFLTAGLTVGELDQARLGFSALLAKTRDEANTASQFDQYLQAEYFFTDKFSVLSGLRNSSIEIDSRNQFSPTGAGSGSKKYEEVTSNLGFTYRLQPNISTYISYGEGFETPTLLETAYLSVATPITPNFNTQLEAAKSEQLEVGVKARFGNTKLNAALYTVDTENEIVVLATNFGMTAFQNGGSTSREGAELAVQHSINKEWQTNAAVNYIRATYDTSVNSIIAGNSLPSIPRKTFFGEVVFKPSSLYEAATELRYVDKLFANDANSAFAPSYSVVNLRASKDWPMAGGWNVRTYARVDNVFDKQYVGSVIVNQGAGQFFEPASERQFLLGVTLGMKWK